ncbi:MAG TPA: inositol monophosphatase [Candidatus Methylomirabilis sp.]|nr:inositol monophosphatase [Candidatus Methylomirabilis sp.]
MGMDAFDHVLDEEPRLATAVELAWRAGRMARDRFQHAEVSWKADDSMVTDVDLQIQAMLKEELTAAFPRDDVLGEEELETADATGRFCWVLDPIDGTNNFGRGMPGFSVSIGVIDAGRPSTGAVYDPLSDQLFAGHVGRGAWLDGQPLRLEPTRPSGRSLCSIRTPFADRVPPFVQQWLCRYRLRRTGSTALTLCYVALGALAFVYDQHASLWDIAGAAPIVMEAGAILTDPEGGDLFPIEPSRRARPVALLAGDPIAHEQGLSDIRRLG